ncbi:hypothetical protein MMB17_10860 [Methylobacterium organophilum]|uniref:hypothetical protein n=1 Tax=Methylobacterium organophilum TaxID=410 RepID=UPI001F13900A|nr:hypothetical protein [Methylobacterium organophilum]UMY19756.1 hypothetical protein MMB17_10860 [Methylobacterium organophilum]
MVSRRTSHFLRASLAALALSVATGAAMAQGYGRTFEFEEAEPLMSPRAVAFRLFDRGFTEIGRPRFDGAAYVVDATNPAGARVRLIVDPRSGAVLGRERLDVPYFPGARPPRAAGFGWTEEEPRPRRVYREAERLVPPADIPDAGPPGIRPQRPGLSATPPGPAEAAPFGLNPDARGRADSGRRSAKLAPVQKPAAPRATPAAPAPKLEMPQEVGRDSAKAGEPPRPAPAEAAKPAAPEGKEPVKEAAHSVPPTPAAVQPPSPGTAVDAKPAEAKTPDTKAAWQDPPAGEKKVRVIGGATIVPGGGGEAAPAGPN